MSKLLRSLVVLALAAIGVAVGMPTASAAGGEGYDVSYPQCPATGLPKGAFGIVGVNGGLATTANSCLTAELQWASGSAGGSSQPLVQLYLNTANPGQIRNRVTTWPSSGFSPRYGNCDGRNTQACSWVYGSQRAQASVSMFTTAVAGTGLDPSPGAYTWWLDVETANTWETGGSTALANNRAALEGWTDYLTGPSTGAKVGLYSTSTQWRQIAGTVPATSSLYTLPSWLAGASSATGAAANCKAPALVGGAGVTLAQYVSSNLDHDVSCV